MTVIEMPQLEQGSEEWLEARRGLVTASVVGQLITVRQPSAIDFACPACGAVAESPCVSKRGPVAPIKTLHPERTTYAAENKDEVEPRIEVADDVDSRKLLATLAAERVTNWTDPLFITSDMWRGVEDEPRARDLYSQSWAPVHEVGFMVKEFEDGSKLGYSPDGLVGEDGLIEIKSRKQTSQFQTVVSGNPPPFNYAQLQAGLLVTGRKWIDYCSYSGGMEFWKVRIPPDPRWFAAIEAAVKTAEVTIASLVERYQAAVEGLPLTERIDDEIRI